MVRMYDGDGGAVRGAMIEPIKIGWKALQKILNDIIIQNLNRQKPIKGDGILISETASGTIISTIKRDDNAQNQTQSGSNGQQPTGSFLTVIVFDTEGNPMSLNVFTDGTISTGGPLMWKGLLTVDPVSCTTTSVTVLTHP